MRARVIAAAASVALLAGCASGPESGPVVNPPSGSAVPSPTEPPASRPPVVTPTGTPEVIADGLDAPWSVVRLPDGGVLVSERDSGRIVEVLEDGSLREAGVVDGVASGGEGGLLGLAHLPGDAAGGEGDALYAYFSTDSDNRVVRMPLTGAAGDLRVGEPEPILTGIPRGGNHNGGRLAFGPDGFLYVTTGDAGDRGASQDLDSLGGKILRMTPGGEPAPDNPFDSLVFTLGHRNVQGIAWDSAGGMWAAEFGQNTWDELNRIVPGGNYGWPEVEGRGDDARFVDPTVQWPTAEASPSGIAVVGDTVVIAALRGERLWWASPAAGSPTDVVDTYVGEYGRFRDVVPGPDGELWALTSNTDGRGSPREGDDRLLRIPLEEAG